MLDAHFNIRDSLWRDRRQCWPLSADDAFSTEGFQDFANAVNPIRGPCSGLHLIRLALSYSAYPKNREALSQC